MNMKYTGKGNSVGGVPARDLTDAEVKQFGKGYLLSTGLYKEILHDKPKRKRRTKILKKITEEVDEPSEE
jgi:hypothetical protein